MAVVLCGIGIYRPAPAPSVHLPEQDLQGFSPVALAGLAVPDDHIQFRVPVILAGQFNLADEAVFHKDAEADKRLTVIVSGPDHLQIPGRLFFRQRHGQLHQTVALVHMRVQFIQRRAVSGRKRLQLHRHLACFSNHSVISFRRLSRWTGLPERDSSWFSPWKMTMRVSTPL